MRFVALLVALFIATPTMAQTEPPPVPSLPPAGKLLEWTKDKLFPALDGYVLAQGVTPTAFRLGAGAADKNFISLLWTEQRPPVGIDAFLKDMDERLARNGDTCADKRHTLSAIEGGAVAHRVTTMRCGPAGRTTQFWIWIGVDTEHTVGLVLGAEAEAELQVLRVGSRIREALGLPEGVQTDLGLVVVPETLAEAIVIAFSHAGYLEEYRRNRVTHLSSGRLRYDVDAIVTGRPGWYEVNAASCGRVIIREVSAEGLAIEERLDFDRLRDLLSREGENIRTKAGTYGERRIMIDGKPHSSAVELANEVLTPDLIAHVLLNLKLNNIERFCPGRGSSPLLTQWWTQWWRWQTLSEIVLHEIYVRDTDHLAPNAISRGSGESLSLRLSDGRIEIEAPSCSRIVIRDVIESTTPAQIEEERYDLDQLRLLLSREGERIRVRPGNFGQRVRGPLVFPMSTPVSQEEVRTPLQLQRLGQLLYVIERACSA